MFSTTYVFLVENSNYTPPLPKTETPLKRGLMQLIEVASYHNTQSPLPGGVDA